MAFHFSDNGKQTDFVFAVAAIQDSPGIVLVHIFFVIHIRISFSSIL